MQLLETNFGPICWDSSEFQAHLPLRRAPRSGVVLYRQLNGALGTLLLAKVLYTLDVRLPFGEKLSDTSQHLDMLC